MTESSAHPATAVSARIGWAVLATIGAGALHLGGQQRGFATVAIMAAGLATVAIAASRLLPSGTVRLARGLPTVIALRGIAAAAFFGTEIFLPLLLSREHGFSATEAGLILTTGGLGWFAGSILQSRAGPGWPPATRLRFGLGAVTFGILFAALAIPTTVPGEIAIAGWTIAGFGMGLTFPTLAVVTLELSAPSQQGFNSASLQLSDSLSASVMMALGGTVFAALIESSGQLAYLIAFAATAAIALLGALTATRIRPRAAAGHEPETGVPVRDPEAVRSPI